MGNIVTAVGWILNPNNGEITGYRRKINGVDTDFPFPLPGTSAPLAGAQLVANPLWEVNASTGAIEGYRRRVAGIDTNYQAYPGTGTVAGNLRLGVQWLANPLTGELMGYRVTNSDGSVTDRAVSLGASLNLDFANASSLDARVTFTRASTATYFNAVGTLTSAAIDAPRLDYNPSTLAAQGLLIEEARANSIRNNTMVGAVAGTPGTLPTNWAQNALSAGLTANILGTGASNGIAYIDIRISGTTADALGWAVVTDANTQIAASSGQVWTGSSYVAIIGGSTANITTGLARVIERNSGGGYITESNTSWTAATAVLANNRIPVTRTLGGTAAFVQFGIYFQANSGAAIDITLRIGLPQLELGAYATSVIPTTTVALTRAADVASVNTLSPWYNASEGTLYAETLRTAVPAAATYPATAEFDNGTLNRWGSYATPQVGVTEYRAFVTEANVPQADIGGVASRIAINTVVKQAFAAKLNDFALSVNGSAVFTDTAGTLPATINRLGIGSSYVAANFFNGYIRRITYYPRRLSNAELQSITT